MFVSSSAILLVHDNPDLLDIYTRLFESRGYEVAIAATEYAALARLWSDSQIAVVLAVWDSQNGVAERVYQWALENRYDLRGRFVFLADGTPERFDRVVQGRCLLVSPYDFAEVVQIAESTMMHGEAERKGDGASAAAADALVREAGIELMPPKPSLLLIEDEPLQLHIMTLFLTSHGYAVTAANSATAAIAQLRACEFDVILCDWCMADGSGGELFAWLSEHRPRLAERCVFVSATILSPAELQAEAPGRPFVPKGQDSSALLAHLAEQLAGGAWRTGAAWAS